MKNTLQFLMFAIACCGCASKQDKAYDQACEDLLVGTQVESVLRDYRANRGGNNESCFEILRSFCIRRMLAAPRDQHPEWADPILDKISLVLFLGKPDEITDDETWLYYFNQEKDWHLELSFRGDHLFYTSYRQLLSADELTTNSGPESRNAP